MNRYFYADTIANFLVTYPLEISGQLSQNSSFSDDKTQKEAWRFQIESLQSILESFDGRIFFEYSIPRMGRRIDVVLIVKNVLFILEYKVGERVYARYAIEQAWDYALINSKIIAIRSGFVIILGNPQMERPHLGNLFCGKIGVTRGRNLICR